MSESTRKSYLPQDVFIRAQLLDALAKKVIALGGSLVYLKLCNGKRYYSKPKNEYRIFNNETKEEIMVKCIDSITFMLDNFYYNIQFNNNPFHPTYITKADIEPGMTITERFNDCYELDTKYVEASLNKTKSANEKIDMLANELLQELKNTPTSEKAYSTEKIKVPNTYDNNYHYEFKSKIRIFTLEKTI